MSKNRILLSGTTSACGLGMARALHAGGFSLIGTDAIDLPLGLSSRYISEQRLLPPPYKKEFPDALRTLVQELRPDGIVPHSDTIFTGVLALNRAIFESLTGVNVPSLDAFLTAVDKDALIRACETTGVPAPIRFSPGDAKTFLSSPTKTPRRLVVKPRFDWGASHGVCYVSDPAALDQSLQRCRMEFGEPIVQEYIPGDATAILSITLLFDRSGSLAGHFTLKKLRVWPLQGGLCAISESIDGRDLVNSLMPLFEHLDWTGPAEIEVKWDARDKQYKVMEVNPRISGAAPYSDRCGFNLPALAARAALNDSPGPLGAPYATGRRFISIAKYIASIASTLREGAGASQTARSIRTDLSAPFYTDSFDWRDPLPAFAKLLLSLRHGFLRQSADQWQEETRTWFESLNVSPLGDRS